MHPSHFRWMINENPGSVKCSHSLDTSSYGMIQFHAGMRYISKPKDWEWRCQCCKPCGFVWVPQTPQFNFYSPFKWAFAGLGVTPLILEKPKTHFPPLKVSWSSRSDGLLQTFLANQNFQCLRGKSRLHATLQRETHRRYQCNPKMQNKAVWIITHQPCGWPFL